MSIKGEYWWTNGQLVFADGNIGDYNHEGYAVEHAQAMLLDLLGIDADNFRQFELQERLEQFLEEQGYTMSEKRSNTGEDLRSYIKANDLDIPEHLVTAAFDLLDVREYAMREWKWKWIKKMWVGTYNFTREDFKNICLAYDEILDQDIEPELDEEIEIRVVEPSKLFCVKWVDIVNKNFDAVQEYFPEPTGTPNADKMDREALHSAYKDYAA